jgi:hypothetical protein
MKCIKNNKTGDIQRVTDREAYKMVTRKPKVEETTEEIPTEKVKSKKQLRKEKVKA